MTDAELETEFALMSSLLGEHMIGKSPGEPLSEEANVILERQQDVLAEMMDRQG